ASEDPVHTQPSPAPEAPAPDVWRYGTPSPRTAPPSMAHEPAESAEIIEAIAQAPDNPPAEADASASITSATSDAIADATQPEGGAKDAGEPQQAPPQTPVKPQSQLATLSAVVVVALCALIFFLLSPFSRQHTPSDTSIVKPAETAPVQAPQYTD